MKASEDLSNSTSSLAQRLFGIDVRSLAALRIGIACLILVDLLFFRWPFIEVFLTDQGLLSRSMAEEYVGPGYWSVYGFDGSVLNARILMTLNVIAAIGLLAGFKTRAMTLGCLVLAWSIQTRNPLILSGGDVLLRVLLLWSVFLPLGAVWSIDSWHSRYRRPARYIETSMASAAMMLQMAMLYFFAGLSKCNSFWSGGSAVELAMQLEMYTKPLADIMLAVPWLLAAVTIAVLGLELVGPWLLFLPWQNRRLRIGLLIAFWSMHMGIGVTMSIGIFSGVAMVGWLVFLPGSFWDRIFGRPEGFASNQPADYPTLKTISNVVCAVAMVFSVAINVANAYQKTPTWYREWGALFARTTMIVQEFQLWGVPPTVTPSFEYPAVTEKGSIDLLAWYLLDRTDKPASEYTYLNSQSWRRLHWELRNESELHSDARKRLLDWLVNEWNRSHSSDDQVISAKLVYRESPIPNDNGDVLVSSVWAQWP